MTRLTDLKKGDRVRLLRDCADISGAAARSGETGTLGRLYRVQKAGGPYEVWELLLDRTHRPLGLRDIPVRICVSHEDIERVSASPS
jgi:hypothetical protein